MRDGTTEYVYPFQTSKEPPRRSKKIKELAQPVASVRAWYDADLKLLFKQLLLSSSESKYFTDS